MMPWHTRSLNVHDKGGNMTDIDARLNLLEIKNSHLQILTWALTAMIAAGMLLGAAPPKRAAQGPDQDPVSDEVRTKRLVIVDDHGNERVVLEVAQKRLNNEIKTDERKEVFATIRLNDSKEVERASVDASDSGLTRLKLFSKEGKRRIEIFTSPEDFAKIFLYDKNGEKVIDRLP
jgi:hypothetical protein